MRTAGCLLSVLFLVGCGGESQGGGNGGQGGAGGSSSGTGADGGAFTGGAGAQGGSGGNGGSAGASGSAAGGKGGDASGSSGSAGNGGNGGDGMTCCLAFPTCGPGEQQFDSPDDCPPDQGCREVTLCCATIYCALGEPQCNGVPACDAGDAQVDECGDTETCYTRTRCGSAILCRDDACIPEEEYNRKYVGMGSECALIDFVCEENTTNFSNECGCGCEQSQDCPRSINCQPGTETNPDCNDRTFALCPYTPIAL